MNMPCVQQLTDWIVRDAARRPEFAQYDLTEVDFLCRKYLGRPDLLRHAPCELLAGADRELDGLLRRYHPVLFPALQEAPAAAA